MKYSNYKPLGSILVKPAGPDCNLGCTYCFYLEKAELFKKTSVHRMDDEVLETLIRQGLSQSGREISFTWQGGEPTLAGLDFFKKVVMYERMYGQGKIVGNGLQTNGTKLTKEWAEFLASYDFLVGLSLDGPEHIHNHYRVTKGDKPTWDRVMESLELLQNHNVAVNAMCCITDYSSDYAEELYEFYKSVGLDWMQFIPVVETDKENPNKAAPFSLTAQKYAQFLKTLFDLWINDFENGEPTTHIRNFDSLFYTYVDLPSPECTLLPECGVYPTVEHNGNVYSCDFFVENKWKLGNIKYASLIDMLNSKKQKQFGLMKRNLPQKCNGCKWYKHCFGGCTKDRIKDAGDEGMPRFCSTTIQFLEYADPIFKDLATKWKEQQAQQQGDTYNAFYDFNK